MLQDMDHRSRNGMDRAMYLLATGYMGPLNTSKEGFQHMGM